MKKFLTVLAVVALVAFAAPAFAANPFMDVPAGHWAYDAVAQLAADGIISGYPDGAFKGAQPATRYEVASMVARALAKVDMDKASKQDLEMLKKLVMEFKDELDALGVKVDGLDKRVAVLENRLGGWKLRGTFWFDANFAGGDTNNGGSYAINGKDNSFDKQRFRLFLSKQIDENTDFYAEWRFGENEKALAGEGDMTYNRIRDIYLHTKLPYDIDFKVGRIAMDFEGNNKIYTDKEALFGDFRVDGFQLKKAFDTVTGTAIIGRNSGMDGAKNGGTVALADQGSYMTYVLDLNWKPNDKFFLGATGYWFADDETDVDDMGFSTYNVYGGFNFTPSVKLLGTYYWEDLDSTLAGAYDDSPKAWKVALDLKQDLLKFTALRFEYVQRDNNFIGNDEIYGWGKETGAGTERASVTHNKPVNDNTSKMFMVRADQKWNDKWSSWLRYAKSDFDTDGIDDSKEYGIAVTYQYTPAIAFRLGYDYVDYGDGGKYTGDDNVLQFRTTVNF